MDGIADKGEGKFSLYRYVPEGIMPIGVCVPAMGQFNRRDARIFDRFSDPHTSGFRDVKEYAAREHQGHRGNMREQDSKETLLPSNFISLMLS